MRSPGLTGACSARTTTPRCTGHRAAPVFATWTTGGSCSATTPATRYTWRPWDPWVQTTRPVLDYEQVQAAAVHVLPVARGRFQPYPLRLDNGSWLVSVGKWVVVLDVDGPGDRSGGPATADNGTATQEHRSRANESRARGRRARPLPDAVAEGSCLLRTQNHGPHGDRVLLPGVHRWRGRPADRCR